MIRGLIAAVLVAGLAACAGGKAQRQAREEAGQMIRQAELRLQKADAAEARIRASSVYWAAKDALSGARKNFESGRWTAARESAKRAAELADEALAKARAASRPRVKKS